METIEKQEEALNLQTTEEPVEQVAEQAPVEETPKPSQNEEVLKKIEALEKQVSRQQSEKDKAVRNNELTAKELAEVRQELKAAKAALEGLRGDYSDDPDFKERLESHKLRSELEGYREETKKQQKTKEEHAAFMQDLVTTIQDMGVNPQDPELNETAKSITPGDYRGLRKALLSKATEIKTRGRKPVDENYESLKAELDNLRKQLAGTANEALPPDGKGMSNTDDVFLKEFSAGKRNSPADFKRAQELIGL